LTDTSSSKRGKGRDLGDGKSIQIGGGEDPGEREDSISNSFTEVRGKASYRAAVTEFKYTRELAAEDRTPPDVITNFNAELGGQLIFSDSSGLLDSRTAMLKSASSRKSLRRALKSKADFVYNKQTGELFLNANGAKAGYGELGGLMLILEGAPQLSGSSIQIL
jgi:hypothetical protein